MLVQGALAAPVMALGGDRPCSPTTSRSFAGFALTGWAFCLLVQRWTGSWCAGYVAGSLAAFNAYTLVHLTHLQFLHAEFVALMLFALDRLIVTRPMARRIGARRRLRVAGAHVHLPDGVFGLDAPVRVARARAENCWSGGARGIEARCGSRDPRGARAVAVSGRIRRRPARRWDSRACVDDEEAASWANYVSTAIATAFPDVGAGSSPAWRPRTRSRVSPHWRSSIIALSERRNAADPRFRMCAVAAAGCAAVSFAPLLPFYRVAARGDSAVPGGSRARAPRPGGAADDRDARRLRCGVAAARRGRIRARGRWPRRCCS